MSITIGHASINEIGKSYGGMKGDQNSEEVYLRPWYNGNWTSVIRHKDASIADKIASACEAICANENVGYSSSVSERNTLWDESIQVDFDFSKISKACSCDCSSLVQVCAISAGVAMAYGINAMTTRTMVERLMETGEFERYTTSDYTRSDRLLRRGDILHKTGHTAIVTAGYEEKSTTIELPILKLGDKGDAVEAVQRLLSTYGKRLGNNNPYDGKFGKLTEAAVTEFQSDNNLPVTGFVDSKTWATLILGRWEV